MPEPAVTTDVLQARNILGHLSAQLPFDDIVFVHQRGEPGELVLMEISGNGLGINPGLMAQLASHPRPYTVEILERIDGSLLRGNVDAEQTRHGNFSGRTRDW
jgi:hypothetical protein